MLSGTAMSVMYGVCVCVCVCVQSRGPKKAGKRGNSKKGSKKASGGRSKSSKKPCLPIGGDDLSQKIYQTMEKHKDVRIHRCDRI